MRPTIQSAVFATALLCTTAVFAASKAVVNIPFNFESNGQTFPAGQYVATVDTIHNLLAFSSMTDTRLSTRWIAGPADSNPGDEQLILKFDDLGKHHTLRTVQLGSRITSRLDAPSRRVTGNTTVASRGQ